jgi:hypothetical protein
MVQLDGGACGEWLLVVAGMLIGVGNGKVSQMQCWRSNPAAGVRGHKCVIFLVYMVYQDWPKHSGLAVVAGWWCGWQMATG